jgi:prolyl-tRNA editing enzyme YbaK/EbsC (Cys-tRNA(Pro) deacylase)
MLLSGEDGTIIVAVLPGHKKLNIKKLKKLSGHKDLRFMDKEGIEQEFGLVVGALAPVGNIIEKFPVFVDRSVFEEEEVDISSGDPAAGVELRRSDLRRLLKYAAIDKIAKEG